MRNTDETAGDEQSKECRQGDVHPIPSSEGTPPVAPRTAVLVVVLIGLIVSLIIVVFLWTTRKPTAPFDRAGTGMQMNMFMCVYDVARASETPNYKESAMSKDVCRYIVVCCFEIAATGLKSKYADGSTANRELGKRYPNSKLYFGVVSKDGSTFADLVNGKSETRWFSELFSFLNDAGFGGLFFLFPDLNLLKDEGTRREVQTFYNRLSLMAVTKDKVLVLGLPNDMSQLKFFTADVYLHGAVILVPGHMFPPPDGITCMSPYSDDARKHSLSANEKAMQDAFSDRWRDLKGRTVFSLGLSGYRYSVRGKNRPVIKRDGKASVRELRGLCSKFGVDPVRTYVDNETDCLVSASSASVVTSMNPLGSKFVVRNPDIGGIMVFDMDSDDYGGTCAARHSLVTNLFCDFTGRESDFCFEWSRKKYRFDATSR